MSSVQHYQLEPRRLVQGRLQVPGDKSISHRSLMLGGIADGDTQITGFLNSADCLATLGAMRAMGVQIDQHDAHRLTVHGRGLAALQMPMSPLDMGNAGTAIRLFMGILSGRGFVSTLTGDESLRKRPMERVAEPLRRMGAQIETTAGRPPVVISPSDGPLRSIDYALPVASAQVKSAILLAALQADGMTRLVEPAPTRDHTERMLKGFGVEVESDASSIRLRGGQPLRGMQLAVPGDFSSAAFFLVAGCLAAEDGLLIENVGINPTRTGLLDILELMGADIQVHPRGLVGAEPVADLEVHASQLKGIVVPEALVPLAIDEFPVLFIAAAGAQGETVVTGATELRVKESDRLAVMAAGLERWGVRSELSPDGIKIQGGRRLQGGIVESHGDHRIAMSFAIASLLADQPIRVNDVANVDTSFPEFEHVAGNIGLAIHRA